MDKKLPKWVTANKEFYRFSKEYQRYLRLNLTEAEKVVWAMVRNKRLDGYKFRRQHIIGVFIVDFVCVDVGLVIEIDGRIHDFQKEYDEQRTAYLNEVGFRVIRFTNDQVMFQPDWVRREIQEALVA